MIAVDTNVLLRRLLEDDAVQTEKARHLFESAKVVLITDIVLAETVWTLKGKRYGAQKEDIVNVVMSLLEEPNVFFESKQVVWTALQDFIAAKPVKTANGLKTADFADAMIVNKTKLIAARQHKKYQGTYTFDKAALEIAGTEAP